MLVGMINTMPHISQGKTIKTIHTKIKRNNPAVYKPHDPRHWKIGMALMFLGIYGFLYYFVVTYQYRLDFSSFYSACQAIRDGNNPYQVLLTTYLPTVKKLPVNLNPPAVLWMFNPLSLLNYDHGVIVWSVLSFMLGLIGASIAFKHAFPADFLKKNRFYLYVIYLSFFATIMDTAIAQLGALLLFCAMLGYHAYLKNRDYSAGILWGLMIAIKLFPGLLLIFALAQKRYRVCITMLSVFVLIGLIPWLVYGQVIYAQYFFMLSRVLWYGDSWNASFYGFLFRLFIDTENKIPTLVLVQILYSTLFCICFFLYLWKMIAIERQAMKHQSFCLTLAMMLFLSPFGWIYYFPILVFPLALTWLTAIHKTKHAMSIWFLCLFFINFPMDYIPTHWMASLVDKLSFFSFHFYGLLLLIFMTNKIEFYDDHEVAINKTKQYFIPVFYSIFSLSFLVIIISFLMRLFSIYPQPHI